MAKQKDPRLWPQTGDLLAWFLFAKMDNEMHPTPPTIIKWGKEFSEIPSVLLHVKFYEDYEDFRKEYLPHDHKFEPYTVI